MYQTFISRQSSNFFSYKFVLISLFFFKPKTAYEITVCLEFRRVFFRSQHQPLPVEAQLVHGVVQHRTADAVGVEDARAAIDRAGQIGRASCRGRVEKAERGRLSD